jgi:hypothetical protein
LRSIGISSKKAGYKNYPVVNLNSF